MVYRIRRELVPRNIAGRYFIVDTTEKDYYDTKQIFTVNQSGYEMFKIMDSLNIFSENDLFTRFVLLFNDITPEIHSAIKSDISFFLQQLIEKHYVTVEGEGRI